MPTFKQWVESQFWSQVEAGNADECWIWKGACHRDGRGHFQIGTRSNAARIAWMLANDADPGPLFILHSCDNNKCVNPAHLRTGTAAENAADKVNRGRAPRGSTHYRSGLTDEAAEEFLRRYIEGEPLGKLSTAFGVSVPVAHNIVCRVSYRHVACDETALAVARKAHEKAGQRAGQKAGTERWGKLSQSEAEEIRREYASGQWTQEQLASRYGIRQPAISRVVNGLRWRGD